MTDPAQPGAGSPAQGPAGDESGATPATRGPAFDRRMLEALVCPVTHAPLAYDAGRQELVSRAAHLAFPIRGGIPIMLATEARDID